MAVDLDNKAEKTFSLPQNANVVFKVANGAISFEQSDCPDKICIKSGKLSKPGQTAACLPNGIIVKIVPQKKKEEFPDAITGR